MPLPLQVQLFDAFLGNQEGIHSILLPDVFSSGGSSNVYMDKFGRVTRLGGYARTNASAVVTNGGSAATRLVGVFPYQKQGGGSAALMAIFTDGTAAYQLFKSTDGGVTWTFVYDAGSSPVNIRPDFAQLGNNLFITNGKVAPRKWDGSSISAAGQTRTATPSSSAGSAGNLNGHYTWRLVSIFSDGTKKAASASSTDLFLSNAQGSVSWSADADTNVKGYEVYRTSGTGGIFYLVSYVDGRLTTSYTDNTADINLLTAPALALTGDVPPTTYYCEPHEQRIWWGNTDANPTRAYWSDVNAGDSVYTNNYLDFTDSDTSGDAITGMQGGFQNGSLMVFTQRAVWRVTGTGDLVGGLIVDWTKTRTAAVTGAVSARSIVKVPAGARWGDQTGQVQITPSQTLAYFTPLGDIRLIDGNNETIISFPVKDTVAAFSTGNASQVHAVHDALRKQIIWFFPSTNAIQVDTAVCWNYAWGAWYKWTPQPFACSCLLNDGFTLVAGEANTSKGGFLYKLFSGTSFDGSAFTAQWMSKVLYGQDQDGKPMLSWRKRFRWADFLFAGTGASTLNISWLAGLATDTAAPINTVQESPGGDAVLTLTGDDILTTTGDDILVSASSAQLKVLLNTMGRFYHDQGIRLSVSDTSSNGAWSLESFALAYQVLTGLKRREQ